MDKIFGGPIIPTLLKLALLSFIVGIALFIMGIDPVDLWSNFGDTIRDIWGIFVDALNWGYKYVILGAIIVLPIWIIYRLVAYATRTKS